jgi:anti-anti-sigma factor
MTAIPQRDTSSSQFAIDIDVGLRTLYLVGELDGMTAPCVLAVGEAFLAGSPGDLTLDLCRVMFADSALHNAIVQLRRHLDAAGAHLRLINHSTAIKRLFLAGGEVDLLRTRAAL